MTHDELEKFVKLLSEAMLQRVKKLEQENVLLREGIKTMAQVQANYGDKRGHPDG